MTPMNTTPQPSAAADFDFLVGTWPTQQRRLKKRLQNNDEWETFDATSGHLEPPVAGRFNGDEDVFECDDTQEGRPVRVRWQQSFSPYGGRTWEVNWTAGFKRCSN
jgi:hypothetical protein